MTDPNTVPVIRIDTRPKPEPIPEVDTNGIGDGEGGDRRGSVDSTEKIEKEASKELIKTIE